MVLEVIGSKKYRSIKSSRTHITPLYHEEMLGSLPLRLTVKIKSMQSSVQTHFEKCKSPPTRRHATVITERRFICILQTEHIWIQSLSCVYWGLRRWTQHLTWTSEHSSGVLGFRGIKPHQILPEGSLTSSTHQEGGTPDGNEDKRSQEKGRGGARWLRRRRLTLGGAHVTGKRRRTGLEMHI